MQTVYYRNGEICDRCADEHSGITYRHGDTNQRVVYRTEGRIISSRPSSSQYVANRDDPVYYSARNSNFYSHLISKLF